MNYETISRHSPLSDVAVEFIACLLSALFLFSCNSQPIETQIISHGDEVAIVVNGSDFTARYLGIYRQQNENQTTTSGQPRWLLNGNLYYVATTESLFVETSSYRLYVRSLFTYPDSAGIYIEQLQ